jgi:MFS family permease
VPGLLIDVRPLRESPPFRRLWLGTGLSALGGQLTTFAVALQVYTLTHASVAVGAVGLFAAVPAIALGLPAGSIVDRWDRRRLALLATVGLTIVSLLFAVQAFLGLGQLWVLYGLVAAQAAVNAVGNPASRTFLPRLLPAERVPAGAALTMLAMHLSVTFGPLLAGLLAAAGGLRLCYVIDALTFAGALYGIAGLPPMPPVEHGPAAGRGPAAEPVPPEEPVPAEPVPAELVPAAELVPPAEPVPAAGPGPGRRRGPAGVVDGVRFIAAHRVLAPALLADVSATVLGMPFALFPAINAERFGGLPITLGLLAAAPAVGGVLGSTVSGPVTRMARPGLVMLIAGAVWGGGLVGFGVASPLALALAALVVAGAADVTSVVSRTSIVQLATPDAYRGRASAAEFVVGVGCPQLGNARAGAVASLFTPAVSAVSGGLATIAGAVGIAFAFPALVRYRRPL